MTASPVGPLAAHPSLQRNGPVLVVVLDGVGLGAHDTYDAVAQAETPTLDALLQDSRRFLPIQAHGTAVGLPSDGDMGNSEVGHNALGCGRVVTQGAGLVDTALSTGALAQTPAFADIMNACKAGGTLHLIGLLSDGGVHSRLDQVEQLLDMAKTGGAQRIRLHVLLDGRDVEDRTADKYVDLLQTKINALNDAGLDVAIASGGGRMGVTMDRYEADWGIVEKGWKAHVLGDAPRFASANDAIFAARDANPDVSDQNLPPFVVEKDGAPVGTIEDGDAVVCFNFRGDRVIEISRAFVEDDASWDDSRFDRVRVPNVTYAGMMQYDGDLNLPPRYLVAPPVIEGTAGEWLAASGVRTFACSETQKFGHVTYFWNGNRSGTFDDALETYVEIPSDNVSFDEKPAMKALEIADETVRALQSGAHDFLRVNIANGDMVGHTGDLDATITAMEVVDEALKRMLDAVNAAGGRYIVTADHGNADDMAMRNKDGSVLQKNGQVVPKTSHTLAKVPFVVGGAGLGDHVGVRNDVEHAGLANVTATYLNLLGFAAPEGWAPSLLRVDSE